MGFRDKLRESVADSRLYRIYHKQAKYYRHRNDPKVILSEGLVLNEFKKGKQTFFGYYDHSPERNGRYIYHAVNSERLDLGQTVDIYCDEVKIADSRSWNWQQGTMLSWMNDDEIIFNDFDGNKYISRIININSKEERKICYPIYNLSHDSSFALSLNFSRLAKLRPDYGYFNLPYQNIAKTDENDGIFMVDLENNTCTLFLSLKEISSFAMEDSMRNAYHKVNHIMLSPDDKRFIFLHRWYDQKMVKRTRLVFCDIEDKKMQVLVSEGMVSHCCWKNNHEIIGYLRYQSRDGYYLINIEKGTVNLLTESELMLDDGHMGTDKEERYMICDSYPDYTCKSRLMFYDLKNGDVTVLGRFFSPKQYEGVNRCDLHPRFSADRKEVTFDSVHSGLRHMCRINLSDLME